MVKKILIILASFITLLTLVLVFFLKTPTGQQVAFNFLSLKIKEQTSYQIKAKALQYSLPFRWKFEGFEVFKAEKLLFSAEAIEVRLSLLELFQRHLNIQELLINHAHLFEMQASASDASRQELPILGEIALDYFEIKPFLWENRITHPLYLKGSFSNSPFSNLSAQLDLSEQSDFSKKTHLSLESENQQELLNVALSVHESKGGYIQTHFGLNTPMQWSLHAKLKDRRTVLNQIYQGDFSHLHSQGFLDFQYKLGENAGSFAAHFLASQDHFDLQDYHLKTPEIKSEGFFKIRHFKESLFDPALVLDNLEGNATFEIAHLQNISSQFKGPLSGHLHLSRETNKTESLVTFKSSHIHYQDQLIQQLVGQIKAHLSSQQLDGSFQTVAQFNAAPIEMEGDFNANVLARTLNLLNLKAFGLNSMITGSAEVQQDRISSRWRLASEEVEDIAHFFKQEALGSLLVEVEALLEKDLFQLHYQLETPHVIFEDIRIQNLKAQGFINDMNTLEEASIETAAGAIDQGQLHLENFKLQAHKNKSDPQITYGLSFGINKKNQLELQGRGLINSLKEDAVDRSITLYIDHVNGFVEKNLISLLDPVAIDYRLNHLSMTPFNLRFGQQGSISASLNYDLAHVEFDLAFQKMPLEFAHLLNKQISLKGFIDGKMTLNGPPEDVKGHAELSLSQISVLEESFAKIPPFQALIQANLSKDQFFTRAQITQISSQPIEMEATLPIHLSLAPFQYEILREGQLQGRLRAQTEIAPLMQIFVNESTSLKGVLKTAVELSGTLEKPILKGSANLSQGSFESLNYGSYFDQIEAQLTSDGQSIILERFRAKDGLQGVMEGKGKILVDTKQHFPFEFNFQLRQAQLIKLDYISSTLSGNLLFKGNRLESILKGSLTTDSLEMSSPKKTTAAIQSVEVTFVNVPRGQSSPIVVASAQNQWPIGLDLDLNIPSKAFIRAENLSSEWRGHLKITGSTQAPLFNGELKVVKGEANFNGKAFEINQGAITFNGDLEKKTTLYVIASQDLGEIIAEIILKGSIKKPSISFRSNPPLSQREILSWLLFGHGTSDNSAFQGEQLNQSITDLDMKNNEGPDMLTRIRTRLGIDRLDISKKSDTESDNVSVKVGKTISKGLVVTLNKGIMNEANRVGVEASLTRHIKLQAEVGDDSTTQMLLKWKKNY